MPGFPGGVFDPASFVVDDEVQGTLNLPLSQSFPTTRAFHQMPVPGDDLDDGLPPATLFGFIQFVGRDGRPMFVPSASISVDNDLKIIDFVPTGDLSVWRLRLFQGLDEVAYDAVLTIPGMQSSKLSLILHDPVPGPLILTINVIGVATGGPFNLIGVATGGPFNVVGKVPL